MRWIDPDGRPRRHARVWLDRATWQHALQDELAAAPLAALAGWIDAERALVARRRAPADGACALGVALPVSAERARIGFTVDSRAIVRMAPPLTLAESIASAPHAWRTALTDLDDRATRIGTTFHVYGSLAWQAITGEPCVRSTSDVDLLWTAASVGEVERVLALLATWEAAHAMRADGELVLANGDAIAWRELTRPTDRVLVKHQDHVSLQPAPACWHAQMPATALG